MCDPAKLIAFLQENPAKATAWAGVLGIVPADIPTFIAGLTPVVLRSDTRVTNHGFSNGAAIAIPAVLQAGTAVLVDKHGFPVTKCFCGNPLTAPTVYSSTTYVGPQWTMFVATSVTVIVPVTQVVNQFTIVEPSTGNSFQRPTGSTGGQDGPVTTAAPPSAPAAIAESTAAGNDRAAGHPAARDNGAACDHRDARDYPAARGRTDHRRPADYCGPGAWRADPGPVPDAGAAAANRTSATAAGGTTPAPPTPAPPTAVPPTTVSPSPSPSVSQASWVIGDCYVAQGQAHAVVLVRSAGAAADLHGLGAAGSGNQSVRGRVGSGPHHAWPDRPGRGNRCGRGTRTVRSRVR